MAVPAIVMLMAVRIQKMRSEKITQRTLAARFGGQLLMQLIMFPYRRRLLQLAEVGAWKNTANQEVDRQYLSKKLHFPIVGTA